MVIETGTAFPAVIVQRPVAISELQKTVFIESSFQQARHREQNSTIPTRHWSNLLCSQHYFPAILPFAAQVEKLTAEELEVAIQERSKPLVIDFYATWCGPCLLLAKELEQVRRPACLVCGTWPRFASCASVDVPCGMHACLPT